MKHHHFRIRKTLILCSFAALLGLIGYTVLLCFTLFKTGSLAKSVLHAH